MDEKMTARLYRALCPPSTELGEYALGMLFSSQAKAIEAHLAGCPHCRRELAGLRQYLQELAPDLEFSLAERVKVFVARLLGPAAGTSQNLAFGLRGEMGETRTYSAGEAELTVEVQTDPNHPELRALLGLVTGLEGAELTAALWRTGELLAREPLDDLGNFMFQGLAPGNYDLILAGPEVEIHVTDITL
jgi:hypothetical protein